MHIRQVLLLFLTRTTLANQVVYCTSRIKPVFSNFCTSSLAVDLLSSLSYRFFWETDLASLYIESLWHITYGSTPDMSSVVHANRSGLSSRSTTISPLLSTNKLAPSRVFFSFLAKFPFHHVILRFYAHFILSTGSKSAMTIIQPSLWCLFGRSSVGFNFKLAT